MCTCICTCMCNCTCFLLRYIMQRKSPQSANRARPAQQLAELSSICKLCKDEKHLHADTIPAQAVYRRRFLQRIRIRDYICRAPAGGRADTASSLADAPSETSSPARNDATAEFISCPSWTSDAAGRQRRLRWRRCRCVLDRKAPGLPQVTFL